jgi:glycosyltransferase involved in cell wall biosynthesis
VDCSGRPAYETPLIADPLVSVVIPTRNRPETAARAIQSALDQTLRQFEVILVIDGEDEATARTLKVFTDPRLIVVTLPVSQGASVARNTGVRAARGKWIAFLDDDDFWLPRKLEIQLQTAMRCPYPCPIVVTRVIARNEIGEYHWPRRIPRADENISEYLFCRKSPFGGEALVLPSAILTLKELAESVPFRPGLEFHNDCDWLLRACRREGTCLLFVETTEPLAVWNIEENRPRLSNRSDWQLALAWIRNCRELVTQRAYASFVLTEAVMRAVNPRDWRAFYLLLRDAYQNGKPSFNDLVSYLGIWLVPRRFALKFALIYDRLQRIGSSSCLFAC